MLQDLRYQYKHLEVYIIFDVPDLQYRYRLTPLKYLLSSANDYCLSLLSRHVQEYFSALGPGVAQ